MDDTSVKVAVRIRPLLDSEIRERCTQCVRVVGNEPQVTFGNDQDFTFDFVFGTDSMQSEIYDACVSNLVDATFEGFNATVLAYGQTSSGKTYTMGSASNLRLSEEEYGIIPRVAHHVFDTVEQQETDDPNSTYRVRIQFLEIYGEEIRDLLDPTNTAKVTIRETPAGGVYISGAREELVTSSEEMLAALEKGSLSRTTGSTRMNDSSSRSHAIFTILLERTIHYPSSSGTERDHSPSTDTAGECGDVDSKSEGETATAGDDTGDAIDRFSRAEPEVRKCKFHFVDLAGSERAKRTGAEGVRLREGIDINKGLLVLGNVISALGDEQKRGKVHVPYRDSKLTRMLQDSLGGNSKTQMICCVSPADSNYNESLNAVRYANRARNIQNKPVVNIDPTSMLIMELRGQIQVLARELLAFREGRSPSPGSCLPISTITDLVNAKNVTLGKQKARLPSPHGNAPRSRREVSSSPSATTSTSTARSLLTKSSKTNMGTIKLEQEILVLKSRVDDGDQEILRLNEKNKRSQLHISEMSEQMIIIQSERDYYKMRWEEACVQLGTDSTEADKNGQLGVIAAYIKEIECLKLKIAKQELELNQRPPSIRMSIGHNMSSAEGADEYDLSSHDGSAADILDGELSNVANVITSTEEQLLHEKRLLQRLENGEDGDTSDDDIKALTSGESGNENMAEKDRIFQRRQKIMAAEFSELNDSIQLKEQLVLQLHRSQKQYAAMKTFYEEKLQALCQQMETKEAEKQRVLEELHELSLRNEIATVKQAREDQLRRKLHDKDSELQALRKRQAELSHLSKVQSRSAEQLRKLESDIVSMKRQRVELARKLQFEKKEHLSALNKKAKEIDQLRRELSRAMTKVQKLGREKEQAEVKVKEIIRDNVVRRKRLSRSSNTLRSSPTENSTSSKTLSSRETRRILRNTPKSGGRVLSEEELKTKKWLDKQVRGIAAREDAAEALRLQCEQQLALINKKKQLEDLREPLRSVIVNAKRLSISQEGSSEYKEVALTADEEEALADVEAKISKLESQLKFRNAEIARMEKKLKASRDAEESHQMTIEMLKQNSASSLPAAHQLIHLLFDILVSTRKSARSNKEKLEASRQREFRLQEDLEDAQARINSALRHHDKELARVERDYEEKLAGLFNHSNLGQVISSESSNSEMSLSRSVSMSPRMSGETAVFRTDSAASDNPFNAEPLSPSSRMRSFRAVSAAGQSGDNTEDRYKAMVALAHERAVSLKSHLTREEARVRELERCIDEYVVERKQMKEDIDSKQRENTFLEDECRMLREMVEDFRTRLKNLDGGIGEKIIKEVRDADEYSDSDESTDGVNTVDSALLGEFSTLGDEILRTGSVSITEKSNGRPADTMGQNDIFERLTNPSNFTGTQKNIFEKDVESNRAKVQQIKEGSLAHKKRKEDSRGNSVVVAGEEADDLHSDSLSLSVPTDHSVHEKDVSVTETSTTRTKSREGVRNSYRGHSPTDKPQSDRVSSSPGSRSDTVSGQKGEENVFTRLLNPSKFTGIHRRRTHLPDSPGRSTTGDEGKGKLSPQQQTNRSSKRVINRDRASTDTIKTSDLPPPPPPVSSPRSASFPQHRDKEKEVPKEKNVFSRLHRRVSESMTAKKNGKSSRSSPNASGNGT
mmetsp:Transcript_1165/g.1891  ORF Transcript_1165/g.1891 Transcript_1165/m.1891 type:complete len:1638 (+) Transcript_1165:189-5102(+)|eukprot:CAMPEP_0185032978 /NCGR_PEP_ID=MMETSP1103-20130426/21541_1 /TAXON_ID=36769 /ORGANISM="Paraphysomonas bandaiensis, Strain Caron Lab Isolate" /LENGTH=1637 /DNA_ID=CAMNT_0027569089 /DNA_START=130 /DNA_END=5043 /DNA_ORIENTATION=+